MKTKNLISLAAILVATIALTLTSCKKDDTGEDKVSSATIEQVTADENEMDNIMSDAESDVSTVLVNNSGSLKSTASIPCNVTISTQAVVNDTITIYVTYNGLNCSGTRNRTGQIEIKMRAGTEFEMAGATVIFKYVDFTVTRVATNKSVTLNGTLTYVNVSGGHRWQVGTTIDSYVEKVFGAIQASFNNGVVLEWNVARQLTLTGVPGQFILAVDGFGESGAYQNLVAWGENQQGETFFGQITQSVIHRQACDWNPCSGVKIYSVPSEDKTATVIFGYNSNFQPIAGDECPTYYRIDWTHGNKTGTTFLPL